MLLTAVLAAAVLVGGLLVAGELGRGDDDTESRPAAAEVYPGIPRQGNVLGRPDAPVIIEEWSDFQCPVCRRFYEAIEPLVVRDYVASGRARFVYRDFAFLGQESRDAAEAARCADEQGKFWEYHGGLFERQGAENSGAFSRNHLERLAGDIGLDSSRFEACLDSGAYTDDVIRDLEAGRAAGVSGTPTIVVNGRTFPGLPSWEQLRAAIEDALAGG